MDEKDDKQVTIKDFVGETLTDILAGIDQAGSKEFSLAKPNDPSKSGVNFELAVTVSESKSRVTSSNAKARIYVVSAAVGRKWRKLQMAETVSRVKFKIYYLKKVKV